MTGEQFLNSIRYLDCEITALDNSRCRMETRRQDLLEQAQNFGANLSGNRVQHTISSKTEDLGVQLADLITPQELVRKLNDYQRRINKRIDELVNRKQKAQDLIDKMPVALHRILISNRYLSNLKWSTIADLTGYSIDHVRGYLKSQAMEEFEAVYKLNTQ